MSFFGSKLIFILTILFLTNSVWAQKIAAPPLDNDKTVSNLRSEMYPLPKAGKWNLQLGKDGGFEYLGTTVFPFTPGGVIGLLSIDSKSNSTTSKAQGRGVVLGGRMAYGLTPSFSPFVGLSYESTEHTASVTGSVLSEFKYRVAGLSDLELGYLGSFGSPAVQFTHGVALNLPTDKRTTTYNSDSIDNNATSGTTYLKPEIGVLAKVGASMVMSLKLGTQIQVGEATNAGKYNPGNSYTYSTKEFRQDLLKVGFEFQQTGGPTFSGYLSHIFTPSWKTKESGATNYTDSGSNVAAGQLVLAAKLPFTQAFALVPSIGYGQALYTVNSATWLFLNLGAQMEF